MKRKYFVAFDHWSENNNHGVASTIIERDAPVSDWDDILNMTNTILSRNTDYETIVISNWRRFEDPE
jgi:hypothetical protein